MPVADEPLSLDEAIRMLQEYRDAQSRLIERMQRASAHIVDAKGEYHDTVYLDKAIAELSIAVMKDELVTK